MYAVNADNSQQRLDFTFQVGGACGLPLQGADGVADGVMVCSPAQGATYSNPAPIAATAKITGTLAQMEVWVDGVERYSETNSTSLNTSIGNLSAATTHEFDMYAVNTAGQKWETTVYADIP